MSTDSRHTAIPVDETPVPETLTLTGTGVDGVEMPRIGLGTWPLRGAEARDAVEQALRIGYRHVDTAQNYGNEDAVGEGIAAAIHAGVLDRDQLFVTTKVNREHHGDARTVRAAVECRLRVLGLEHVDLVLVHWPNPDQDRYLETAWSLSELAEDGRIRAWGVSNFTPAHLDRLAGAGLRAPVDQIEVGPLRQSPAWQEGVRAHGAAITAYSPLGRADQDLGALEPVAAAAARTGRTPAQVVLRWHLQSGRAAVPKSADPARQAQNLDVFSFALTAEEMAAIDALDTGEGPRRHPDEFGH